MKNMSAVWELIYLLLLMCAGVIGAVSLLPSNTMYMNYRFLDKSLIEVDANIDYVVDENLTSGTLYNGFEEEYTSPQLWDDTYSAEDLIAITYIQDDTCPPSRYGDMKIQIGTSVFTITDKWAAQREAYLRDVRGNFYAKFNTPSLRYYIRWDMNNKTWNIYPKTKEYVHIPNRGWDWKEVN